MRHLTFFFEDNFFSERRKACSVRIAELEEDVVVGRPETACRGIRAARFVDPSAETVLRRVCARRDASGRCRRRKEKRVEESSGGENRHDDDRENERDEKRDDGDDGDSDED